MRLLGDPDTELTVRIGINAVFEGMEGNLALQRTVPALIALSAHRDAHIRGDAAHLLSLTHDPACNRISSACWRMRWPTCARSRARGWNASAPSADERNCVARMQAQRPESGEHSPGFRCASSGLHLLTAGRIRIVQAVA